MLLSKFPQRYCCYHSANECVNEQIVWGPLCFATAVSICRGGSLRYPLQIIVSLAHLYGVALYYSTCYVNEKYKGLVYSRPEFLYFWVYYVGFNAPWVFVPAGKSPRVRCALC